jgi:hypothetical protein
MILVAEVVVLFPGGASMKFVARSLVCLTLSVFCFGLGTGCEAEKGPAQKAGEKVDSAVQKAKDKLDPAGPVEKAGRAVDNAAK